MRNAGLEETQAGIKIARRNINNLRYTDDTTLMAESEEELKSLLIKVKEESEKLGWELNIQKTKIMESDPIISWQIDGKTVETVADYIFRLQNHCRWWLQPWNKKTVAPWKKSYDQPRQHIKKRRHYFANKGLSSQGYGFSSSHVMDVRVGLQRKLSTKELMLFDCGVGEDSLRVLWTARWSNQWILKEISPECSLEGLMLKLKLLYFGHLMQRADWFEKTLMLGKIEGKRKRRRQDEMVGWHHQLNGHEFE